MGGLSSGYIGGGARWAAWPALMLPIRKTAASMPHSEVIAERLNAQLVMQVSQHSQVGTESWDSTAVDSAAA